jgi:hypothetical protein
MPILSSALRTAASRTSLRRVALFAGAALVQVALVSAAPIPAAPAQKVTPPAEHLGRPVGADFQLADWDEVSSYYAKLDRESARVSVVNAGVTTLGREFPLVIVGAERNLARLDEIKAAAKKLADPRGLSVQEKQRAVESCVPILMISIAMHSNEAAAPQFGMELAYELATSDREPWASAREKCLVLILPCTNPDGLDGQVAWYRRIVGTPFEAAGMHELYQHYCGHDNNRDWFALTQAETRNVTRLLYHEWRPHVYWDVHQQGQTAERFFTPPFRDPLNPNIDPLLMGSINSLGTRAQLDMLRDGLTGVATGVTFDQWWNGGNRNVPVRHNIIGLLTEAASVNFASPVFLERSRLRQPGGKGEYGPANNFPAPWPGGWWRLRDIIEYELSFARSLLRSLSAEPRVWLEQALNMAERAVQKGRDEAPRAWIVPAGNLDRGATRRLIDGLQLGGVEVHVATSAVTADGVEHPAGSIVILADQPYGRHVKDLFEVQRYPEGDPPYDVAGWTLPLLYGVQRVECVARPSGEWRLASDADDAVEGLNGSSSADGVSARDSDGWASAIASLSGGESLTWDANTAAFLGGERPGEGRKVLRRMPRIGVYAPYNASMSEGWMRWVFDTWKLPYTTVRNEHLRAGKLSERFDVLILPDVNPASLDEGRDEGTVFSEFARGLEPEGAAAIEEFVRAGDTLIAIGGSARWAIGLLDAPLVDTTREKPKEGAKEFSCPGSVLRAIAEPSSFTAGLDGSLALMFAGGSGWRVEERKGAPKALQPQVLLKYAAERVLYSGWIRGPEALEDRAAWVRVPHGEGAAHLFGFSPHYRGWSQATFQLLFRAALLDG